MAVLQARTSFAVGRRSIAAGALVRSDDPVVKGREALFVDPAEAVEQATKAPGERRAAKRAAPKPNDGPTRGLTTKDAPKETKAKE